MDPRMLASSSMTNTVGLCASAIRRAPVNARDASFPVACAAAYLGGDIREHSPPLTLKLHEGSALLPGKAALLFYSEKLCGDVVFCL